MLDRPFFKTCETGFEVGARPGTNHKKKLELFCFGGFGRDKLRKHPRNPYLIESYDGWLLLEHLVDAQLPIGAAGALAEVAT